MTRLNNAEINALLHRNLHDGNEYEKYFEPSVCKVEYLNTGNTDVGIQEMIRFSKRYAYQVEKLSFAEFSNLSLQETAYKIHWFLYNNIQYSIDGFNQKLKAPNCLWATRQIGADCKTYSVTASMILLNLGIKHYFRRVDNADNTEHVYVVVPTNQVTANLNEGYYVIDATTFHNSEQRISTKNDFFMNLPYYGMAAPDVSGCTCNSNKEANHSHQLATPYHGKQAIDFGRKAYNDAVLAAMDNFDLYLQLINADENVQFQLRQKIVDSLYQGYDPVITIRKNGIAVNDEFITTATSGHYGMAGFWDDIADIGNFPAYGGPVDEPSPQENGGTSFWDNLASSSGSLSSSSSSQDTYGNLASTAASVGSTALLGFDLTSILGVDFFSNTFGAIFANGLELSCWNSSYTPQQTAAEIQQIQGPYFANLFYEFEQTVNQDISSRTYAYTTSVEEDLNFLAKAVYVCRDMYWFFRVNENWERCSRLALDQFNELFYELVPAFESTVSSLASNYIVTEIRQEQAPTQWEFTGFNHSWSENSTAQYPVFSVRAKNPAPATNTGNTNNPVVTTGGQPNNNNTGVSTESNSSIGKLLAAGAVAFAGYQFLG
ncbi:hypothetical protein EZY14_009095 [Kordia sp. TARA_039_SRF]|nr:hypothetical protein EZY14_009095 [Kordia sp. TARA_039_SRF]